MSRIPRITRAVRLILLLGVATLGVLLGVGLAAAEQGGGRVIILPLKGPGGVIARNEIAKTLEGRASYVQKIGAQGAQRPARTAREHNADAMIGGWVRCPSKACLIDLTVYRRSGQVWTKGTTKTTRARIGPDAAELATKLLEEVDLFAGGGGGDDAEGADDYDEEEFEAVSDDDDEGEGRDRDDDEFTMDDFEEEEGRRPRRSREHDFDALEVYFNFDLTLVRNLCVDLAPELENNIGCNLDTPAEDDRTYVVSPFANLGFRLTAFPGAFFRRRAWWSHIGVYLDYGHSLSVTSQREYETPTGEALNVEIPTSQQDLRVGVVYRLPIPLNRPTAPQLRFMLGFGWYEYDLDDRAYPLDSEVTRRYHDSNPYLPSFAYTSFDIGLGLRVPIRSFLFPYTQIAYRAGMGSGQAERIYGAESSINGVDWELGLAIEVGLGIRFIAGFELIWYQTKFAGEFEPESEEEGLIWGGDIVQGDTATDLVFRLRFGAGWSF